MTSEVSCHVCCLFPCMPTSFGQSLFPLPFLPSNTFCNLALTMAPLPVHVGFRIKQIWEELPSYANVVSSNTLGNKLVVSEGSNTKTNTSPNLDPLV